MRRIARLTAATLLLLGTFWAGRESTHGLSAFWEHWWCPVPLAMIVVGIITLAVRRPSPAV
ncbi:MAG: hypothetical protein ACR2NJ_00725 [Acidimicrobiales bacterium]